VLNSVDKVITDEPDSERFFVRYGDDILLAHTNYDKCKELIEAYTRSLEEHRLPYHTFKSLAECKDGEKTTNVAVAQNGKDGKDGATAPSPTISDNGMWVVYSWDAAKGEFVAEETEIPAAGTSAYVVLKNGVYTLNIADETGEFVEVALPATAESFTINGIANKDVKVV
jgi:hypothetical protein